MSTDQEIQIKGARMHNLQNIDVTIPKKKFVVVTGVSGSGKSSLAFDTIYAEGQRRYVESLSSYARQFLQLTEKPDVDLITGLSPAISIDQKTAGRNPRSTVGTITEINDYMRLLYARVGQPHCPECGKEVQAQSVQQITKNIIKRLKNKTTTKSKKSGEKAKTESSQKSRQDPSGSQTKIRLQILSPVIRNRKGEYKELFENLLSQGFIRARIDGEIRNLEEDINLEKYVNHTIEIVVDRLVYKADMKEERSEEFQKRLIDAVEVATNNADGEVIAMIEDKEYFYSENNSCPECEISFPKLEPHSFSFNSPHGACPECSGLGNIKKISQNLIYNPNLSISEGGIFPWSRMTTKESWMKKILEKVAEEYDFSLKDPIGTLTKDQKDKVFHGTGDKLYEITYTNRHGTTRKHETTYEGVIPNLERRYEETSSDHIRQDIEKYMQEIVCDECGGKRLRRTSLAVLINDKNISQIHDMTIKDLNEWFASIKFNRQRQKIAKPIVKEIKERLTFLSNVGLEYLSLSRKANTLSGGEAQRIRLASQIGTGLTGVLYVLDEPSIGLHDRDINRLLTTLKNLRDLGNTVIVVEHDEDTMKEADWIIDMGPGAGEKGGEIIAEGTPRQILKDSNSLTGKYLSGQKNVERPETDQRTSEKSLILKGASEHNLQNIDVEFPLGKLITVTGVSGSGKSSLVNDTLYKILVNEIQNGKQIPGKHHSLEGIDNVDKIVNIDQSPIGRTPRSNAATYTGVFTPIRELFAQTKEAKARGYDKGRFSFNVKGGRCETCSGDGQIKIEMQFLPDMYITCEECGGKRYNREVLQIDFKGKNIADVLDMTVNEALEFFKNFNKIKRRLKTLRDVGLGYIRLGQPAPTLSGGEAQRIKLSSELSKMPRGHTVYLLDEPTTGLHFDDVNKLIKVLHRLVDKGHTVIIIEHNLDVIKSSDWIIDLGPEGGDKGGELVAEGSVEDIMANDKSFTGKALKKVVK
jgi:excinuclease ABC subunit A